jgi:hypothetical protein
VSLTTLVGNVGVVGIVGTAPARLDPTNGEARSWLQDELAKPAYRDTRDPLTRALQALERWLLDLLDGAQAPVGPLPTLVAGLVAVALVALVVYTLRYVRRTRRAASGPAAPVLGDERLTAQQYRGRAQRALADGLYAACVLDLLRAIARDAVERTILEDAPSLTAHEIAGRLEAAFPATADELRWAADRFDAVAYGEGDASRADAERMVALDRAIATARPVHSKAETATEASTPAGVGA